MENREIVTLREHIEENCQLRHEAHAREHVLLEDTRRHEKESINYRLEGMNQFRDQLTSERSDMATREYVEGQLSAMETRIISLEKTVWMGMGLLAFAVFAVPLVLKYIR